MKVIDLLNKIANGEIYTGTYVIYKDKEFIFTGSCLENIKENSAIAMFGLDNLNEEVEIIEDKKIIKLDWVEENTFNKMQNSYLTEIEKELLDSNFKELGKKINEIIDYLKENKKCL